MRGKAACGGARGADRAALPGLGAEARLRMLGRFHEIGIETGGHPRIGGILRAARFHAGDHRRHLAASLRSADGRPRSSSACISDRLAPPSVTFVRAGIAHHAAGVRSARHRARAVACRRGALQSRSPSAIPAGQRIAVIEARTYSPVTRAAYRDLTLRLLQRIQHAGHRLRSCEGVLGAARFRRDRRSRNALPAPAADQRPPRHRLPPPAHAGHSDAGVHRPADARAHRPPARARHSAVAKSCRAASTRRRTHCSIAPGRHAAAAAGRDEPEP